MHLKVIQSRSPRRSRNNNFPWTNRQVPWPSGDRAPRSYTTARSRGISPPPGLRWLS